MIPRPLSHQSLTIWLHPEAEQNLVLALLTCKDDFTEKKLRVLKLHANRDATLKTSTGVGWGGGHSSMSALRKKELMTHSTSNLKYWSDSSPSVTTAAELLRGTTQAGGGRAYNSNTHQARQTFWVYES